MIRPIAIASDGLLDERRVLGIATRGYIWIGVLPGVGAPGGMAALIRQRRREDQEIIEFIIAIIRSEEIL
jgi:hypothetical protein